MLNYLDNVAAAADCAFSCRRFYCCSISFGGHSRSIFLLCKWQHTKIYICMQVCVCVCVCDGAYVCVEYLVACFFARTPLSSLLRAFAAKSTAKATHNTRTGPPPYPSLPLSLFSLPSRLLFYNVVKQQLNKIYANMQTQHAPKTKPDTHAVCVREKQSSAPTRRQCKALDVWLDKRVGLARLRSVGRCKSSQRIQTRVERHRGRQGQTERTCWRNMLSAQ